MVRTTLSTATLGLALCLTGLPAQSSSTTPKPDSKPSKPVGTTANWPSYRGNPSLEGVAPGKLADRFELAWSFKTEDAILSSPVVSNGVVYFGSSDQMVYAVSMDKGKKLWAYKTDDMVDAPPLVLDGRVYIGSADFFLYALDAKTGKLVWKVETGDKILGAANYAHMPDGTTRLLVGSYDGKLYCFDAKTGKKHWTYKTDNYINGTPAILGDQIIFGGCDAVLHVVSVTTGKSLRKLELGADCHVAGSIGLAGHHAYFGHYGNAFVSVDLTNTKKPAWVYPSRTHAFFSSPAIQKDRVIFGGRDKHLHCVERKTGKPLWKFKTRRKVDGSPIACGNRVVFGSGDGRLYVLDTKTGKKVWSYEIGRPIFSSPAVCQGMIFIGANDNRLYAFRPATPKKTR